MINDIPKNTIYIPKRNAFVLSLPLNKIKGGEVLQMSANELQDIAVEVEHDGKTYPVAFTEDGNSVKVPFPDTLTVGTYNIYLSGNYDGAGKCSLMCAPFVIVDFDYQANWLQHINANGEISLSASAFVYSGDVQPNDVNFFDYNGDLLYSFTKEQAMALTEMPTPARIRKGMDGVRLQFDTWTHNLEELKDTLRWCGICDVGAYRYTEDGSAYLIIKLTNTKEAKLYPYSEKFDFIDWGDGTIEAGNVKISHTYKEFGRYVVRFKLAAKDVITIQGKQLLVAAYLYKGLSINISGNVYGRTPLLQEMCYSGDTSLSVGGAVYLSGATKYKALIIPRGTDLTPNDYIKFQGTNHLQVFAAPPSYKGTLPAMGYNVKSRAIIYNTQNANKEVKDFVASGVKRIIFPEDARILGSYKTPFGLEEIEIPASVTTLGGGFLSGCDLLKKITFKGTKIAKIPNDAFKNCNQLTTLEIPAGVTEIGNNAFASSFSLITLTLPDSLQTFGNYAFEYIACNFIVIPQKVTKFGNSVFSESPESTVVVFKPTTPPSLSNSIASQFSNRAKIYVPYSEDHSILNAYKTATNYVPGASRIFELTPDGQIPE